MEYEFIALDKAREEEEWLHNFLEDIPNWSKPVPAICIHSDSQQLLEGHEILFITISLHIYDEDIIQSGNYSLVELSQLTL